MSPAPAPASSSIVNHPDLAGRVVLVTGGSGGIGAATCRAFAASGALVAVNGRRPEPVAAVVDGIHESGGRAVAASGDCADPDAFAEVVASVEDTLGPIAVLCAFAGGGRAPRAITDIPVEEWRHDVDGNLTATFVAVQACLTGMAARGDGSIVTMASGAARLPGGAPVAFAAAKAGIVNFTQQAAFQAAPAGVRVNCISPAAVLTDAMAESVPEERQRQLVEAYPLGRLGRPDDVAAAALFLGSSASAWVTGVTLDVAGGQIMR
jgi:3-oxoacyl-[acyl-carrier protein] reductase